MEETRLLGFNLNKTTRTHCYVVANCNIISSYYCINVNQ